MNAGDRRRVRAAPSRTERRERERLTGEPGGEFLFSLLFYLWAVTAVAVACSDASLASYLGIGWVFSLPT